MAPIRGEMQRSRRKAEDRPVISAVPPSGRRFMVAPYPRRIERRTAILQDRAQCV
jgi:hypothetical protein